ncbi:MAG: hypothetical protein II875_01010 [Clostridia bacterium]|nr:hypothetical protein [Clostridia bacterium]
MKFDKNGNPKPCSNRWTVTFMWVAAYLSMIAGVLVLIGSLINNDAIWPIGLYLIGGGVSINIVADIACDVHEIAYNLEWQNWKAARKEQMKRDLTETKDDEN